MFFQFYKPGFALCEFVQHIMVGHVCSDSTVSQTAKAFPPAPEQCLYFYPRDKVFQNNIYSAGAYQPFSIIVGPQLSKVDLLTGMNHLMIGVVFRPGRLHRIIGSHMTELLDHYVDSSLVWPTEIRMLEERMNETNDYNVMVQMVERFLLKCIGTRVTRAHIIDEVFDYMIKPVKPYTIDRLASRACLSPRQFERKFNERMGLSPKVFQKIIRFNSAVRMKEALPAKDWLSIALHAGYYDFQHMLRDFREFTNTTPSILGSQDLEMYAYEK